MNIKFYSIGAIMAMAGCTSQAEKKLPNIIIILADDMGYGDISALNENSRIQTPHLDVMARDGLVFTDAHTSSSVSTPSRYGLLTGRYSFRTWLKQGVLQGYTTAPGVLEGGLCLDATPLIDASRPTLGTMLSAQGYHTACIGKWHLGWDWAYKPDSKDVDFTKPIGGGPTTRGFDYFFGIVASLDMPPYVYVENDMPTAVPDRWFPGGKDHLMCREGEQAPDFDFDDVLPNFIRHSEKFIYEHQNSSKPFFLYLPLNSPHTPILPTEEFKGASGLNPYGDFVVMTDHMVGRIVKAVKESGQWENTIIIFTSDNGCSPGFVDWNYLTSRGHNPSYIFRGAKRDIWDGGHRVPFIVTWGDRYKGKREEGIVCLTDFYATFAQMTGYKIADNEAEDSYSFLPALTGKGRPKRTDVVHQSSEGFLALREGDWKMNFCAGSGGPPRQAGAKAAKGQPDYQLYNMKDDPSETNNLYEANPEMARRLASKMVKYIEEGRSTPGKPQANDTERWNQLESIYKLAGK